LPTPQTRPLIEWPTFAVLVATYLAFAAGTLLWPVSALLSLVITTLAIAQFSSLQHEVLHGHPFRSRWLGELAVSPALTIYVPYLRFKDTHLQHHYDPNLTDPYDDPEANFMEPAKWHALPKAAQILLRANNTLLGRMLLGPALSIWFFCGGDLRAIIGGDRRIALGWALHGLGMVPVLLWLWAATEMPIWAWFLAAYFGFCLLKIRTFAEHRAHEAFRARSVIVEDRGPLALLFLNNNLHAVHHMHPELPWYRLPKTYEARKEHYQRRNGDYVFANYATLFREYFLRAKDPVPHPIWPVRKAPTDPVDSASSPAE
jgi:fatty acid desaturase